MTINAEAYNLKDNVLEYQLENGMKWLLVRRPEAPVFSGVIMVGVGGADEEVGKTGLAHVFEHMAFKGSSRIGSKDWAKEKPVLTEIEKTGGELTLEKRLPKPDAMKVKELSERLVSLQKEADKYQAKNEIWEVLSRNGAANLNAYTSKDLTAYFASMPANYLELWVQVMADMIFDPAFREFYIERNVVAEERRSGTENNPDGALSEKILSTAFADGPYHWSTIGFEKDIRGLTIADARSFHDKYYVPSNMTGVLVGDFEVASAKAIIRKVFGGFEKKKKPPCPAGSGKQNGGRAAKLTFNAEPSVAIVYHKPTLPDKAEYYFDIINSILCDGSSSRLQKKLVFEKRLAESVYCSVSYPGSRFSNLFLIWIEPIESHAPASVAKEAVSIIENLSREPVGRDELERVKKRVTAALVFALEDDMGLAQQLADFQTVFGDWRILADYPKMIGDISPEDIMRTAQKYLTGPNRVIVERVKK